jgi:ElaB/YqjD/DUF883 family membrane-anchored ribosome-binding protein
MAKDTFEKTRDFVDEKLDRTKEYLGDSYKKTRERVDDLLGDAKKQWRGVSDQLPDQWEEVSGEVKKYVKKNPVASLAIAAVGGFLIGLLFSRRD